MSLLINIPKHWQLVRVGEYVISVKGKKPKRISSIKTPEYSIPYVNIKAFEKNVIDEYTDGVDCVLCEEGDFLMVWDGSRSGYVGKAIKGALGSTLVKLKFPNIDTNYAYYFLHSKYIEINTRAKGVGIPHVDPNLLWNYNLPIPPLQEQAAIVSKIEELLSDLENGKQQLQIAQQQLKVYRRALIMDGVTGKLTAQWRAGNPNVESSGKMFQKIQNLLEKSFKAALEEAVSLEKRKPKDQKKNKKTTNVEADLPELPINWNYYRLEDITHLVTDGTHFTPKY